MKAEWTNKDSLSIESTGQKAILVIDVDNIDIKNTQATYIELQCNNQTRQMSLVNHWLKPMPEKREPKEEWFNEYHRDEFADGWNSCLDEITGETE